MKEDKADVLVIYLADNKHFLTITGDGRTVFGEGFKSESGAKDFWTAVGEAFGLQQTALQEDNARLRGLIKDATEKHMFCPWCPALGDAFHTRHAKTCPACTRDGTVR